ncbi:MAG: LCP family protein [Actinomycetaceae bacterium]|nr:LCP family protein [Actinomycetaceae bacterium]
MGKHVRAEVHIAKQGKGAVLARVFLLAFLAVTLFLTSSFVFAYSRLQSNIDQGDISNLLDNGQKVPRDPQEGHDYNILVLGSDSRAGDSNIDGAVGDLGENSMRSDTTMIVHISADRSHAEIVSIPRDTLTTIPSCTVRKSKNSKETYNTAQSRNTQFNWAFSRGGETGDVASAAACAIKTTERLTGLTINGYIVVNFAAFQDIVNALGGVPMYFDKEVKDPMSGLHVLEGCRLLDGEQALAFARARKNIGDGSDTGRIGRQQELVAAMFREVLDMNLLTDSYNLYRTLDAGTQSLSTSKGLGDLTTLVGLLYSLRSIDMENIHFITMPYTAAPSDPNRVVPTQKAEKVWSAIANDTPVWIAEDGSVVTQDSQQSTSSPSDGAPAQSSAQPSATTPAPASSPSASSTTSAPVCTKQNALKANNDK